jgi:hypothetical protein
MVIPVGPHYSYQVGTAARKDIAVASLSSLGYCSAHVRPHYSYQVSTAARKDIAVASLSSLGYCSAHGHPSAATLLIPGEHSG